MPIPAHLPRYIKSTLADLYPEHGSIVRVASDAGIDTTRVNTNQSAANAWHEVVDEAIRDNRVEPLIRVARSEYSNEDAPLGRILALIWDDLIEWRRRAKPYPAKPMEKKR